MGKRGGLTSAEWKRREREQIHERETAHLAIPLGYFYRESRLRFLDEQYVTAFHGCRISWDLIEDRAKYYLTSECSEVLPTNKTKPGREAR